MRDKEPKKQDILGSNCVKKLYNFCLIFRSNYVYYGCYDIYFIYTNTMKTTQLATTLTHLCEAYLNTNYITVEDIVDVFNYEQNEEVLQKFSKVMEPARENWFENYINKGEWTEDDLEDLAWKLAMALKRLNYKLKDEEKVEALGIEIGQELIKEGKQGLAREELKDYVWSKAFSAGMHTEFSAVMAVVKRIITNWYLMQ